MKKPEPISGRRIEFFQPEVYLKEPMDKYISYLLKFKKREEQRMANKDKTGPSKNSTGPRDGRGHGKGNYSKTGKGIGPKKGGKKGSC